LQSYRWTLYLHAYDRLVNQNFFLPHIAPDKKMFGDYLFPQLAPLTMNTEAALNQLSTKAQLFALQGRAGDAQ
jgi:hypothetical protein